MTECWVCYPGLPVDVQEGTTTSRWWQVAPAGDAGRSDDDTGSYADTRCQRRGDHYALAHVDGQPHRNSGGGVQVDPNQHPVLQEQQQRTRPPTAQVHPQKPLF